MSTTKTGTRIYIPAPLRAYTGNEASVTVERDTVAAAMQELVTRFPALKTHLYDDQGNLRSFVNVFVNDEDIRHLDREQTRIGSGDELSIVPSIAGGAPPSSSLD